MKYIVSAAATLSFSDGSKFELTQGIHDRADFPENVIKHWAFNSYAEKLSDSDAAKNAGGGDESTITGLQTQITELQGQVKTLTASNTTLTEEQAGKDKTITELQQAVTEKDAAITELQGQVAALQTPAEEVADAKKSKTTDSK